MSVPFAAWFVCACVRAPSSGDSGGIMQL